MEDVSPQSSPPRFGEPKDNQRDSAASFEQSERKGVPPNGHADVVIKPSRWGPPESGPGHHGNRDLVSDKGPGTGEASSVAKAHKRSEASHLRGEESLTKDQSQSPNFSAKPSRASDDTSARDVDKPKSRSVSDSLAVDEFGRLLRQGGSDSDGEGHHGGGKKRRRSMSRSRTRSRSPGDVRRKRWSPSRSPRRRDHNTQRFVPLEIESL
ncbi:hypothetical protein AXG93_2839s1300 [Marchantia polymorpha subsp. ruderalis]|uniref:Uncharacterized protein n=1 Tax=Marchantia polymorpha subsp. ruderalis TaxID=1480154 RepID=A0A176VDT3_MARPO|nr:hypothetical protein AXG93_2839s1300 [Marchantia polymorpha subsp. ruderalis]